MVAQPRTALAAKPSGTLHLPFPGNILLLRSESGRTMEWAQAHFFVAAGGAELSTGLGRGVFR